MAKMETGVKKKTTRKKGASKRAAEEALIAKLRDLECTYRPDIVIGLQANLF